MFYISLLKLVLNNAKLVINVELEEETENEYKVEEILEIKRISGKLYYLVR